MDKRISIITGHYGVGKSEISVNLAINLAKQGKKVIIADMDIINPYFRSNEARHELEKHGVEVIATKYANTNVDIPALTGELRKYLFDRSYNVVMDVGGDDAGALVVGRYRHEIPDDEATLYFVINCFRPETTTVSGVVNILEEIEKSSRMKVSYLINNSHLMDDTTDNDIINGIEFATEVSKTTNIPVAFHAVMKKDGINIDKYVKEPVLWLDKTIVFPAIEK
ncbi:MAG TPA: P-loop NTPase [Thermoclostridium sp.]